MEANIVKVGNSKGIIIPSKLLKLLGLEKKVKIEVQGNKIIIAPAGKKVRDGWEKKIKTEVEKNGQPKRMLPDFFEDEENNDWTW
ncbi:MAG TPA: AbrB/MazE/SpoVT family DNA-binding domain-containing protein [Salinimicrobium sp.]|nr:AbrB/MazE/SpoVT family DNA-binding domain-containing protein [Salinimicrobium sp.]